MMKDSYHELVFVVFIRIVYLFKLMVDRRIYFKKKGGFNGPF